VGQRIAPCILTVPSTATRPVPYWPGSVVAFSALFLMTSSAQRPGGTGSPLLPISSVPPGITSTLAARSRVSWAVEKRSVPPASMPTVSTSPVALS
jgi:hypothetical protein